MASANEMNDFVCIARVCKTLPVHRIGAGVSIRGQRSSIVLAPLIKQSSRLAARTLKKCIQPVSGGLSGVVVFSSGETRMLSQEEEDCSRDGGRSVDWILYLYVYLPGVYINIGLADSSSWPCCLSASRSWAEEMDL